MCDYSLEHLTSRAAKVGDKLVTTHFKHSLTGGFCAIGEPNIAVCLKPGTEIAFDREVESISGFWMRSKKLGSMVARFRRCEPRMQSGASRRTGIADWSDRTRNPPVSRSVGNGYPIASRAI